MHNFINKLVVLLFASIIFFSCKTTKDSTSSTSISSGDEQLADALLWKITGKDIKQPSYLYGTIHLINKDDFFYPEGTMAALDATEDIVFEIDMDDMNDMSKQMGMLGKIFMKDGVTLKDLLSEEEYSLVNNHFKDMGLPMMMLEKFKPMFLTVFASGDMDMSDMINGGGMGGDVKSYEMEFYDLAQKMDKEVEGLETIEYQLEVFEKIPYKDQAKMLVEAIKSADIGSDQFDEMVQMYKQQQITAMVTMIGDEEQSMGEYEDILLKERNMNWIPLMAAKMTSEPTFFAVGAGHLAGKNGVIKLLKKEGYKLTPVSQVKK
jgi:uncharacterized protein YbaP (TraB family)